MSYVLRACFTCIIHKRGVTVKPRAINIFWGRKDVKVHANESDCNAVATTYTGIKLPGGTLFFPHTRLLLPLYYFAYTTIKQRANKIFGSGRVWKQMQINASLRAGVFYIVHASSYYTKALFFPYVSLFYKNSYKKFISYFCERYVINVLRNPCFRWSITRVKMYI